MLFLKNYLSLFPLTLSLSLSLSLFLSLSLSFYHSLLLISPKFVDRYHLMILEKQLWVKLCVAFFSFYSLSGLYLVCLFFYLYFAQSFFPFSLFLTINTKYVTNTIQWSFITAGQSRRSFFSLSLFLYFLHHSPTHSSSKAFFLVTIFSSIIFICFITFFLSFSQEYRVRFRF